MYIQFGKFALGIYRSKTTPFVFMFGSKQEVVTALLLMRGVEQIIAAYHQYHARKATLFATEYQSSVGS